MQTAHDRRGLAGDSVIDVIPVSQMSEAEFFAWHWGFVLELDRTCNQGHLLAIHGRRKVVKGVAYERCARCHADQVREARARRKAKAA
jgi:hypothetical protein